MTEIIRTSFDFQNGPNKIINLPNGASSGDSVNYGQLQAAVAALNATISSDVSTLNGTIATDVANLQAAIADIPGGLEFIEEPCVCAAPGNVNVSSPGASIDGVTLSQGQRVMLPNQTNAAQNGTWIWNGATSAMTRTGDAIENGSVVFVGGGQTYDGNGFLCTTTGTITVGTTATTWLDAFKLYAAGTGLVLTGNVFSLAAPVAISLGGTGATTAAAAIVSLGAAKPYEANFGNGTASSFSFNPTTIAEYPVVQVVNNSTGAVEGVSVSISPGTQNANGSWTPTVTVTAEYWASNPPGANGYHITVVG